MEIPIFADLSNRRHLVWEAQEAQNIFISFQFYVLFCALLSWPWILSRGGNPDGLTSDIWWAEAHLRGLHYDLQYTDYTPLKITARAIRNILAATVLVKVFLFIFGYKILRSKVAS